MDYEQDLQALKEAQKKKAIADLEAQQKQALSSLEAEEKQIKPTYYQKKDSANVQNQVAGRNFSEYLANTGRSNSGIGTQYEMSRQNNLQRSINDLNREEASVLGDIGRRRTDVNNAFQSGLTSANSEIEANYIQNLLNQRQQQWEREFQEKQFEYKKQQDAANRAYQYSASNAHQKQEDQSGLLEYKPGGAYIQQKNKDGSKYTYVDKNNYQNSLTLPAGVNPFTGSVNPDFDYGHFGGYQPDNVGGRKITKTGKSIDYNGQKQNIWTDGQNLYIWDGMKNQYLLAE